MRRQAKFFRCSARIGSRDGGRNGVVPRSMKARTLSSSFSRFSSSAAVTSRANQSPSSGPSLDDAFALLPGNAIAVGTVDARAFFSGPSAPISAKLVETLHPGRPGSRLRRLEGRRSRHLRGFSYQGVDVAAIIVGRFDEAKDQGRGREPQLNKATTSSSRSTPDATCAINNIGFTLLSGTRAVAGTEADPARARGASGQPREARHHEVDARHGGDAGRGRRRRCRLRHAADAVGRCARCRSRSSTA